MDTCFSEFLAIVIIALLLMFSVSGCEWKKEDPVYVTYDSRYIATLTIGKTYFLPLSMSFGTEWDDKFQVAEKPIDAIEEDMGGDRYLRWTPKKEGEFTITIAAKGGELTQSYKITVVK